MWHSRTPLNLQRRAKLHYLISPGFEASPTVTVFAILFLFHAVQFMSLFQPQKKNCIPPFVYTVASPNFISWIIFLHLFYYRFDILCHTNVFATCKPEQLLLFVAWTWRKGMSKLDLSHAIALRTATPPTAPTAPIRLFTSFPIAFTPMSLTAERPIFSHWGSVAPGSWVSWGPSSILCITDPQILSETSIRIPLPPSL